jgi:hypothetical protein
MKKQEMAFPSEALGQTGMTLRDWFAGMALQGIISSGDARDWIPYDIVNNSYNMADWMMEERKK